MLCILFLCAYDLPPVDSPPPVQVDFQRPVVISQVATQGAKQMFQSQYVLKFSISYSTDRRKWIFYKGDSRDLRKVGGGV